MKPPDTIRTLVEKLDLAALVGSWHRYTRLPEEELKDATLEVLTKILALSAEDPSWSSKFASLEAFRGYLRVAVIRYVCKQQQKDAIQTQEVQPTLPAPSPEQALLIVMEERGLAEVIELGMAKLTTVASPNAIQECRAIVKCILAHPEKYIGIRESGGDAGTLVVRYSELAKDLPYKRTTIYDRLTSLRQVLLR